MWTLFYYVLQGEDANERYRELLIGNFARFVVSTALVYF